VFLRPVNSKVVFHQIIGRGSRIDEHSKKYMFRIIDYTNATRLFDEWDLPAEAGKRYEGPFDWYLACRIVDAETGRPVAKASIVAIPAPSKPITVRTDDTGFLLLRNMPRGSVKIDVSASGYKKKETAIPTFPSPDKSVTVTLERETRERKELIRAENVDVYIAEEGIVKVDVLGNELLEAEYIEYCKNGLIKRIATLRQLKEIWMDRKRRRKFKEELKSMGIDLNVLSKLMKKSDVDEFDLIAHLLFNTPLVSRDERARALLDMKKEILERYGGRAREVILELVDRYKMAGIDEITDPKVFRTPPFDRMGALKGVIELFGGLEELKRVIQDIEMGLYPEFGDLGLGVRGGG